MIHLQRKQIIRLGRLLNMYYRPSELAAEIGCHVDTVYRSFIPAGCPYKRDERDHIWIVGTEFAEWARVTMQAKRHTRMASDEAYCLKCRKPVTITGDIQVRPTNRCLELVTGTCAECGAIVNLARARQQD